MMREALRASKRVAALVRDEMARLQVPGVSLGVWHEGQAWSASFGVTNVNHPLPVDEATLFQTGSMSKTFLAIAPRPDAGLGFRANATYPTHSLHYPARPTD